MKEMKTKSKEMKTNCREMQATGEGQGQGQGTRERGRDRDMERGQGTGTRDTGQGQGTSDTDNSRISRISGISPRGTAPLHKMEGNAASYKDKKATNNSTHIRLD